MKAWKLLVVSAALTAVASTAYSCAGCYIHFAFSPCEKTYIQTEQLGFSEDGIFVQLDGKWHQTTSLHADDGGIYIDNLRDKLCTTTPPRTVESPKEENQS